MKTITMVTSPQCHYCHSAKDLLKQHDIEYDEVDLLRDGREAQELMLKSGQRTVPQVFINEKPIGGFTELAELLNNHEFDVSQLQIAVH